MSDWEPMPGVVVRRLRRHEDDRGWLSELFRRDELPEGFDPAMAYISYTKPGVARGPHEHALQTDGFAFLDGAYELHLWENRPGRPWDAQVFEVGAAAPTMVLVPPGVVHAYRNVGESEAFVLNFPDKLYAGKGRQEPVDEIRHENDPDSKFKLL
ncbi:MAG: dTDP-4-dehydrorhamnose 3,5-epimerase family protein [Fimbriimonadaceae bacterium]|nr:dTDP-4-dehydrorhamnose 3,5-epimerase family protein [Fimbriimonadaceae bacterium]QYK55660.1 MAG: dTDP-4-dehydrorhamnose 3,5-epimerase family protein [Fimbriimonadaceae bacterium]